MSETGRSHRVRNGNRVLRGDSRDHGCCKHTIGLHGFNISLNARAGLRNHFLRSLGLLEYSFIDLELQRWNS